MTHTITNNNYTAQISELGAELKSLKNDTTGFEYIWEGDPEIWSGTAPILFPIIGQLKGDQYFYEGKKYDMRKHGIVRRRSFLLHQKDESEVSFVFKSDDQTKEAYPFDFELIVHFSLIGPSLKVSYNVKNTGIQLMYFAIGSHPAFRLDMGSCKLNDYYIEFSTNEILECHILESGLLKRETIASFLNNEKIIPLSKNLFDNDALIFKNIKSREISIKNNKTDYHLMVTTGEAPNLGIWAKPKAPYVCIEPWFGHTDYVYSEGDFISKDGILTLEPGKDFYAGYEIHV